MQQSLAFSIFFYNIVWFLILTNSICIIRRAQYCTIYHENTLLLTWDNEIKEYFNDKQNIS